MDLKMSSPPSSSNRILYDVPCVVCRDHSSGKHYGVFACDGCAGFFKRSVRRDRQYACKARSPGLCLVDKAHRNQCRACRLAKCLDVGMNKDAVQHERGPRSSTIRRQMAFFMKDPLVHSSDMPLPVPPALNLALPKHDILPPAQHMPVFHPTYYPYTPISLVSPPIQNLPRGPSPPPITPLLLSPSDPGAICEAAARILFMNVKWAKNVPAFTSLSLSDRLLLLEESWRDLFIIGAAQFLHSLNLNVLCDGKNPNIERRDIDKFEFVLSAITKLRPDNNEYACLRAIALFKTTFSDKMGAGNCPPSGFESKRLQDLPAVAALQNHSHVVLTEYTTRMYPLELPRSSQLMQILLETRKIPSITIVELFFRSTIGETYIERIISDMYRTGRDAA